MKKLIIFILCFIIIIISVPMMSAGAVYNSLLEAVGTQEAAYPDEILMLVSMDDGSIIFEKNQDVQTAPASLTKIVTAAVVMEKCPDLEEIVTIPREAIDSLVGTNSSNAGLKIGEEVSVHDLLYCMLVASANEASTALAAHVAGTEVAFVEMMNEFVTRIGCTDTHFVNPHGLDEDGHYTSAADLLKIINYIDSDSFPYSDVFYKIVGTTHYSMPETNLSSKRDINTTNKLMVKGIKDYYCENATGIKTGTTSNAGKCVISKATKGGFTYLAIVMNAPQYDIDADNVEENCAFVDCKKMFEWAFDNIAHKPIVAANAPVADTSVSLSRDTDYVNLMSTKEIWAHIPKNVDASSLLIEIIPESLPAELFAPVKKFDKICRARVMYADEEITTIELVAANDVERSLILYLGASLKDMVHTDIFKIMLVLLAVIIILYAALTLVARAQKKKRRSLRVVNFRDVNDAKRKR